MKKINHEVELKKELDTFGVRYGNLTNEYVFELEFYDNKSDTILSRGLYSTPISGIRDLGRIIPSLKIPAEDVTIVLAYVLPNDHSKPATYFGIEISPYLYYTEKQLKPETENKE